MNCSEAREALSSQMDGERPGSDSVELTRHLVHCRACTAYRTRLDELAVLTRRQRAEDLVGEEPPALVLPGGGARSRTRRGILRIGIVALVAAELSATLIEFLAEHGYTGEDHAGHESLSFTIALCVGMIWVAWRPSYARGYLPMVGVAAGLLTATAALDIAAGRAQPVEELPHVTLVGAFVLMWLLARSDPGRPAPLRVPEPRPVAPRGPSLRVVRGALRAAAVAVVPAIVLITGPSWGHATLEGSNPAPDAVVRAPPTTVTLRFDESVTTLPTSLEIYGPDGSRVDDGALQRPGGDGARLAIGLTGSQKGTYLVSWRVISADSHPVSGAFTFSVGRSSATPVAPAVHTDPTVATALGASRWLGYLGAAALLGGVTFLLTCWPQGWSSRGATRLIRSGLAAAAVAAVAGLLLKGPYDAALGIGHVGQGDLVHEVLHSTYGKAMVARLVLLALLAALLLLRPRLDRRLWTAVAALCGLFLLASYAATGHAVSEHPRVVTMVIDMTHVAAMSFWLGGLTVLVLFVVRGQQPAEVAAGVVRRFSRLALVAVALLVSTGTYQAWREVGSWAALPSTTYGKELLVKLGLVAAVITVAALSRSWVRRGRVDLPALRRRVTIEAVGVLLILGVTSALVATEPAESAYHPAVAANLVLGPDTVQVSAVPAGDRRMQVHLYLFDKSSRPTEPREVDASLDLPSKSIGPLPVTLTKVGRGHRTAAVAVPVAGDWTLTILVRTSAIDEYTKTLVLPIH